MSTNYNDTLNLPKTEFPMRANLPDREPETLKAWKENKLYDKIIEKFLPYFQKNGTFALIYIF